MRAREALAAAIEDADAAPEGQERFLGMLFCVSDGKIRFHFHAENFPHASLTNVQQMLAQQIKKLLDEQLRPMLPDGTQVPFSLTDLAPQKSKRK